MKRIALCFIILVLAGTMVATAQELRFHSRSQNASVPASIQALPDHVEMPGGQIPISREISPSAPGLYIIQMAGYPTDQQLATLQDSGIFLKAYINNHCHWAVVQDSADADNLPFVAALFQPEVSVKIDKPLKDGFSAGGKQAAMLLLRDDTPFDLIKAELRQAGVTLKSEEMLYGHRLEIVLSASQLKAIVASEYVLAIEKAPGIKRMHNKKSSKIIDATDARSVYGVTGKGVRVGIWDGGQVYDHKEFDNRLNVVDRDDISNHATHVAGSIGASGSKSKARGMAPESTIYSYDYYGDVPGEMAKAVKKSKVVLSNNSWGYLSGWEYGQYTLWGIPIWSWHGDGDFMAYTQESSAYDKLIRDKGLIILFSAGNDRNDIADDIVYYNAVTETLVWANIYSGDGPYGIVGSTGCAKNVIAVAASDKGNKISSFSSYGPGANGQLKPEITAPGVNIYSSLPDNRYGKMSGTSMACPITTGSMALLVEYWKSLHGQNPSAAVIRNIIAITAIDDGNKGPDFAFGFGHLDVKSAMDLIYRSNDILAVDTIGQKEVVRYDLNLTGSGNVKACLAWLDPAGKGIINDLDLVVKDPNGKVYKPWVLKANKPTKKAKTGVNKNDNIELVEFTNNFGASTWTLEISSGNFGSGNSQEFVISLW